MINMIKKITLASALSVALPAVAVENIIRTPVPTIPTNWVKASPLLGDWMKTAEPTCAAWTPLPEEVEKNLAFTQSRECKTPETRTVQERQYNRVMDAYRLVGDPVVESRESVTNERQQAVGTKFNVGFVVLDATPGVDGIYMVLDKRTGDTFSAYVNMTDDGGNWVLVAYWIKPSDFSRRFNEIGVKGKEIKTYSKDPIQFPVPPAGFINGSSRALLKSENSGWIQQYGTWQSYDVFEDGDVSYTGFPANSSKGNVTLFVIGNAWSAPQLPESIFGFSPTYGPSEACGGNGKTGKTKICPISNLSGWSSHAEGSARKFYFLKAE